MAASEPQSETNAAPARSGNLVSLGAIRGLVIASGVVIQAVAARLLGPEGFGLYGYVTSVVSVFASVANLGLGPLIVREVARRPDGVGKYLGGVLTVIATSSTLAGLGIVGFVASRDGRPEVVLAALLASVALAFTTLSETMSSAFNGLRRMPLAVPGVVTGRVLAVSLTLGLLLAGTGLTGVFVGQLVGALALFGLHFFRFRRDVAALVPRLDPGEAKALLVAGAPFALTVLFDAVYLQSDVLVLAEFRSDEEVALYRVAALLVTYLPMLVMVLTLSIYPRIVRVRDDLGRVTDELGFFARIALAVTTPMAVGGACLAGPLVVLLAGDAYADAWLVLLLMIWIVPLRVLNHGFGWALLAFDRQRARTRAVMFGAVFNVAANLYAIPRWGAAGAAVTTLITELLLTAVIWGMLRSLTPGLRVSGAVLRTVAPSLVMGAVVVLLPPLPVLVAVAAGVAVYLPVAWGCGAWAPSDLRRLRAL